MTPDLFLSSIQQHAWGVVTGCVLLTLVYLARLPALAVQWKRIPAAYMFLHVLAR